MAVVAVAALPVVFDEIVEGISVLRRAGSWEWGSVPVVRSEAETVTLLERACPLTVVVVSTRLLRSVVRFVTWDSAMFGISAAIKAGSCPCGNVPVVRSEALMVTLPVRA